MSKGLVFIQVLSSLHIGSGTGIGVIDMPVQRERHTGYPIIPSSSFKGVLRSKNGDETVFGKEDCAGQKCFLDGKILFYPVRSLKGSYLLLTSKDVIKRFLRDIQLVGENKTLPDALDIPEGTILLNSTKEKIKDNKVVLEEFPFDVKFMDLKVIQFFKELFPLIEDFAILNEVDFSYFVRNASEVYARIALDPEKKVVKEKALFYQEFIPAETIFYSMIINNSNFTDEKEVDLKDILGKYIQLGGNETIGKGICKTFIDKLQD